MAPSVSIVIPVHNGAGTIADCLASVVRSAGSSYECIVIDDGSTDHSAEIARQAGARVIELPCRGGPARARNIGAMAASGEILLFIDADVTLHEDTVRRALGTLTRDVSIVAVIGSYDFEPAAPNFVSQYKNLFHSYVHHHGSRDASTFWTGCGAIRRTFFVSTGGFPVHWMRPSVEDIEFGATIRRLGGRIRLDPELQVKHLKSWRLAGLLRTDIFDRAIPWTLLVLGNRAMPNDLNLRIGQRVCVACAGTAVLAAGRLPAVSVLLLAAMIALNMPLYRFLAARRGWWFAARAVPLHLLYFLYSGLAMAAGVLLYLFGKRGAETAHPIGEALNGCRTSTGEAQFSSSPRIS